MAQTFIAFRHRTIGGRKYQPGDKLDDNVVPARRLKQMVEQRLVLPLDRENYAKAVGQKVATKVGRGFTGPELVELGIIDRFDEAEAAGAETDGGRPANVPENAEAHGRFWVVPYGRPPRYEVLNGRGDLLSGAKRINGKANVEAFIAKFPADEPEDGDEASEETEAE